jgi:nucleotide-binding universal stress UspA family protein
MTPTTIFAIGVFTVVLLAIFVYVSVHELTKPEPVRFEDLLMTSDRDAPRPLRILLAIDGSPCSVAAVDDVAHCRLPNGTTVEILTAIHSRIPVVPDPTFLVPMARAEDLREQARCDPEIQQAALTHLRRHRPHLEVTTKVVEGQPKDVILREATEWRADRVVLGSHGHGRVGRAALGSTAAAVAAEAPCSVVIARPARGREEPASP